MINRVFAQADSLLGGTINPPAGKIFEGGFAGFASTALRIVYILAGLWAFWNIIIAGYTYLSAGGDSEAVGKAWATIWKSLVGLIIIISATVFAALIGWLFFNDPTAILAPELIKE